MQNRFRGLVSAPFTPLKPDRSINLDEIPAYARLLRANGVGAAFVCGTTGEALSLTLEERLAVAEKWVQSAAGLPVIVHVGHTCLADARRLTAHAAQIGAARLVPPIWVLRPLKTILAPVLGSPTAATSGTSPATAMASAPPWLPPATATRPGSTASWDRATSKARTASA